MMVKTMRFNRISGLAAALMLAAALCAPSAQAAASDAARLPTGFSALDLWEGLGLFAELEGKAPIKPESGLALAKVLSLDGRQAGFAVWDRTVPVIKELDGSFYMPLSMGFDKDLEIHLSMSRPEENSKLSSLYTFNLESGGGSGSEYLYSVSFAGQSAWAPEDAGYAVIKSFAEDEVGISTYMILRPSVRAASFATSALERNEEKLEVLTVEWMPTDT